MTATAQRIVTVHLKTPHPAQRRFLRSPAKRRVVRGGRRGGKTTGLGILAVEQFLAGHRVLYAAPTSEQLGRFWAEVCLALREPIDANVYNRNKTEHYIEMPYTEQRLKAKTAWNADTLRGDYADLLILDEFQLMAEDTWAVVGAPMLLDNNGDAVFIYTPPSLHSSSASKATDPRHAAKLFKQAQADTTGRWGAFHFTSHDNPHISAAALADITQDMTALAIRQEILAEDIDDAPGALWNRAMLEQTRVWKYPPLIRIVIGVDPAAGLVTETGIVAVGLGDDGHAYVLEDVSVAGSPDMWARTVVMLYHKLQADRICGEVNNGGEMVEYTLQTVARDLAIPIAYKKLHASRGKIARAEPIAALYEQGRVHHVGNFERLENELCQFEARAGQESPNRYDACFIAGTLVATIDGDVPIERVRPGDRALTRQGWYAVRHAQQTATNAPIMTVHFSDGTRLCGTYNHPVFVQGKGFISLDTLSWGDIIMSCEKEKRLNLMALFIHGFRTMRSAISAFISRRPGKADADSIIGISGHPFTGRFLQALTFTIWTIIRSIMPWKICGVSRLWSMLPCIQKWRAALHRKWQQCASWLLPGISPLRVAPGMLCMESRYGKVENLLKMSVHTVGTSTTLFFQTVLNRTSVVRSAHELLPMRQGATMLKHIVQYVMRFSSKICTKKSRRPAPIVVVRSYASGTAPVYNLEVEHCPEYFANGILVHNCIWSCTELLLDYKEPPPLAFPVGIARP